jgi:hypothetical protein
MEINVDKDIGKLESSYIADENGKISSHYGKKVCQFFKMVNIR